MDGSAEGRCDEGWQAFTVPGMTAGSELAIDSTGVTHLMALQWEGEWSRADVHLHHAALAGDDWSFELLGHGLGTVFRPLGIRADPARGVVICWDEGPAVAPTCVSDASGDWVEETLPDVDDPMWELDSSGQIHVLTDDEYWIGRGAKWSSVDPPPFIATSFAVDHDGGAHVFSSGAGAAYYDRTLRYGSNVSGAWIFEDVRSGSGLTQKGLAVDSEGDVHAAYASSAYTYQARVGGTWTDPIEIDGRAIMDHGYGTSTFGPIALGPDGPHVAYHQYDDGMGTEGVLRHAGASADWKFETVVSSNWIAPPLELEVDDSGWVHILHRADGLPVYRRSCVP